MTLFTESNTVEAFVRDLLSGPPEPVVAAGYIIHQPRAVYATAGRSRKGIGWHFLPAADLPRRTTDVFVEDYVVAALRRLNPTIEAKPERAEEVLYRLRAIVLSVRSDGLIRAN